MIDIDTSELPWYRRAGAYFVGLVVKQVTGRQLFEGDRIPWGYGVAWRYMYADIYVCLPIPFHIIVSALRNLYFRIVRFRFTEEWETYGRVQYERGERSGRKVGEERGLKMAAIIMAHRDSEINALAGELKDIAREMR